MTILPGHAGLLALLVAVTELSCPQPTMAADTLLPSFSVGKLRLPLSSYERIAIATVLESPDRYQMRDIRIAGTVMAMQTEIITNRMICGRFHERTMLVVEDDSGTIEVVDRGACGWNVSRLRAPMLKIGQPIELLVRIMVPAKSGMHDFPVEATIRYIDLARE